VGVNSPGSTDQRINGLEDDLVMILGPDEKMPVHTQVFPTISKAIPLGMMAAK
jgi:hypothetical protein